MHTEYCSRNNLILILTILLILMFTGIAAGAPPKNVIFLIGDGMGFEQVKAAGMYKNGSDTLVFETFPHRGEVTTYSANSSVTDSAAAATAIATGFKVNDGVVSMAYPGDGSELETLLEYFEALGKSTGLVTTTYITHATPACFGAHNPSRGATGDIAEDYLNQTRPNLILGGGANGMSVIDAQDAGYTVVTDANGMLAIDTGTVSMLSGQFGSGGLPYELDGLGSLPHLSEMTETALDILDNDPDGFFLMVEGGTIDWACHSHDLPRAIWETIEFGNAAQAVLDWAGGRTDTLIIVTADHETGGLTVDLDRDDGNYPDVSWTGGHSAANVPVYAWGPNAELISDVMDNTDFFAVATASVAPAHLISGYVLDAGDEPISGVSIIAGNGGGSGTTDTTGYYEFSVPEDWSGTVRPARAGYALDPPERSYVTVTSDRADQDYRGTPLSIVCEGFESGYTNNTELRIHPDWFYVASYPGPETRLDIGVDGSWGLTPGGRIFTWTAHEFDWNAAGFTGISFRMDFQTDSNGHFDQDRIGWMVSDTDDNPTHFFGVQLDPIGATASYNIEAYWEAAGAEKKDPSIVALPALPANAWHRLHLQVTRLGPTAARLDVQLSSLDASGNETGTVASGAIADTSVLAADAPGTKYFTATRMWPAYKNFDTITGNADNACFSGITDNTCSGDFDQEGDVDGGDLHKLASGIEDLALGEFASQYGKTDCQ